MANEYSSMWSSLVRTLLWRKLPCVCNDVARHRTTSSCVVRCRAQCERRLTLLLVATRSSAIADKPRDACADVKQFLYDDDSQRLDVSQKIVHVSMSYIVHLYANYTKLKVGLLCAFLMYICVPKFTANQ